MNESQLRSDIASLPPSLRARLDAAGFDPDLLVSLAAPLWGRTAAGADASKAAMQERNRVRGVVEPPRASDVVDAPAAGSPEHERLAAEGLDAIRRGELALCVMAGGMATRMGGVVKALVEAFDGHTFLDLRLRENATWSARGGRPVPLWLMTSDATDTPIREALAKANAPAHVATFTQDLGLRLTREGGLFRGADGQPSTYAPGHGDLPDALRRSGLLGTFTQAGGKHVWIANLDNLGATIDPAILGHFLALPTKPDVMVEAAPKVAGDKGGIPVWADAPGPEGKTVRRLQVLEEFRLPPGFDAAAVRVFNTNTFLVRAEPLLRAPVAWTWFEVEKKVGDATAVQFERLLQELTAAMPAAYVRVPRDGVTARFLPVKDHDELARRREEIRAVAAARGML
ncbi:MAG TPA: UTP--glucose-1-phosphate uridylyltransferase [Polyangiaceae bacterium]|jgi:UTP--glucose-1-phosphate uridylyltransferase